MVDNVIHYTVRKGDSWYSIAKKHGVNVDQLIKLNNCFYHDENGTVRVKPPRVGDWYSVPKTR